MSVNLFFFDAISEHTYQYLEQKDALNLAYTCKEMYHKARLVEVEITNDHKLNEMMLSKAKRVMVTPECDNHIFDLSFMNNLELLDISNNSETKNQFILPKKIDTLYIIGTDIRNFSEFDIRSMWVNLDDGNYVLPPMLEELKVEICGSCDQLNDAIKDLNLRKLELDLHNFDKPIDFRHMTNLRHLDIRNCCVYDLRGLHLKSLSIEGVICMRPVSPTSVSLKNMTSLKSLTITDFYGEGIPTTDDDLEGLELKELKLSFVDDLNLSKIKSVKKLHLLSSGMSDEYLPNLSIEWLVLSSSVGVRNIRSMTNLKQLHIYGGHKLVVEDIEKLRLDELIIKY